MNFELKLETKTIGSLDCRVVDTPKSIEKPTKIVILCHGFGAPGDDLVPCSREIISTDPNSLDGVRFVFPAAPIQLEGGYGESRAWWPIDMEALQQAMLTGNLRDLRRDEPELLPQRRSAMLELIDLIKSENDLTESDFVLGGFSQGSMVATDVALHMENSPGGLIIWSGTLLNEDNWTSLAKDREADRRFPILQSHGKVDPILPFAGAEWLRNMLQGAGFKIDFMEFNGQHTIPMEAITQSTELIKHLM